MRVHIRIMHKAEWTIGYVRAIPRLGADAQLLALADAGIDRVYVEGRKDRELKQSLTLLTRHVAPETVVAVLHLYVLGNPDSAKKRRDSMLDAMEAIEDKGGIIWELSSGLRSNDRKSRDKMRRAASDYIARARAGGDAGRPAFVFTDAELAVIDRHWKSLRHKTNAAAVEAVWTDAKKAKLHRLIGISAMRIAKRLGPSGRAQLRREKTKV